MSRANRHPNKEIKRKFKNTNNISIPNYSIPDKTSSHRIIQEWGCAAGSECLQLKNGLPWQPNGNKFCSTNYPSFYAAQRICKTMNFYHPESCSHIVMYTMYNGEQRWELLNVNAERTCFNDIDQPGVEIIHIQNANYPLQNNESNRKRFNRNQQNLDRQR